MLQCFTFGRRAPRAALRILSVVAAAAALSGCYVVKNPYVPGTTVEYPNDYRKRHKIALRDGSHTMEVFIGQSRGSLTPTQRAEVLSFAKVWKDEATGGVVIDVPTGTPNQVAASQALREINSIFAASGVPMQSVAVRNYTPENPQKFPTLRLKYSKIIADAGPCGLWPQDLGPSFDPFYNENRNYWNMGCANQRNLAAMVVNPADLVQPRGESDIWTSRRTTVLEKYRTGQPTATVYPNPTKGYLSDIGQ
ncbi:MAG: CpaD family pilus assembly protein [Pseudorhodoplanes sp.]|uniref:CpaD family pilus assembly protein n=1 Tax=Pseudorhodoplanes sp. TaxID=1934341 RepID=UPI003D129CF6